MDQSSNLAEDNMPYLQILFASQRPILISDIYPDRTVDVFLVF